MENKDEMAFPLYEPGSGFGSVSPGLTKRELMAAMAMQGLMSRPNVAEMSTTEWNAIFRDAVEAADALLLELSKTQP